tara:strand:- start:270 stop:1148 length:879 start_codon:yes stop_codon:yes gene_type:complete
MKRSHLAGIIPVANLKSDFQLATPEILLPVNRDFSAIQKSVFECAMAGCNTIWIVANDDLAPVVRTSVGEWVYDPVYYRRPTRHSSEERREIPIYYVPIHPKDRERRDSYGWSILFGIYSAWHTAHKISKWITPEKYYISFPMAMHDIYKIREHREKIKDPKKNFFLTFGGLSVKNNLPLSFTMSGEDFKRCRRTVNSLTTREYMAPDPGEVYPSQKLPIEERWSARHFDLSTVLSEVSEDAAQMVEADWFYDISHWKGYKQLLSSEKQIETPEEGLTKARKHVKLSYNLEG